MTLPDNVDGKKNKSYRIMGTSVPLSNIVFCIICLIIFVSLAIYYFTTLEILFLDLNDIWKMIPKFSIITLIITLVSYPILNYFLSFNSSWHAIFSSLYYCTLFGLFYIGFLTLNIHFDISPVESHTTKIINGYKTKNGVPVLVVNSWNGKEIEEKFAVEQSIYNTLCIDDEIIVEVRNGYFAIPWIQSINKIQGQTSEKCTKLN